MKQCNTHNYATAKSDSLKFLSQVVFKKKKKKVLESYNSDLPLQAQLVF